MTYDPGVTWTVDNITYGISVPMGFDNWTLGSHWMSFNGLGFNLTSPNPVFINFSYFRSHPKSTALGDMIVQFTRTQTTVLPFTMYYNISGLKNSHQYNYNINLGSWLFVTSNATGTIHFNTALPGTLIIKLYDYGYSSPTVQTDPATGTEEQNATAHGTLLDDGGTPLVETFFSTIIRPNGDGTYQQLVDPYPPNHYVEVNEVIPETSHYLYSEDLSFKTDTFLMENPVLTGTINNITLTYYYESTFVIGAQIKGTIRTHGTNYDGAVHTPPAGQSIYTSEWLVNPSTGTAWTWTEINDLEAGASLKKVGGSVPIFFCMYVGVNYSQMTGTTAFFQYGPTTSYGTDTASQYKSTGDTFLESLLSLSRGTLYHFRAAATNLNGTGYGADATFLTKPETPTSFLITNTGSKNIQALTWTHGLGYNKTVIRTEVYPGTYPPTPQSDISIYNASGTSTTVNNTFLQPGLPYYYRAWEYAEEGGLHQFSDANASAVKLTKPYPPINTTINRTSFTKANLSWVKGDGANTTMVRYKSTGYPTSPTDGTFVYNGTGTYYIATLVNLTVYYFSAFSFTTYTGVGSTFSDNATNFTDISGTMGGFIINCYDEETNAALTFNVLVSNQGGTDTYYKTGCTNPEIINESLCPQGQGISIILNASNYYPRIYTIDIYPGIVYFLNAYLPAKTTTGGGATGGGCSPQAFMDSMSINATVRNYVIPLTYRLHTMIEVQVYNKTLGYWVTVPTNMWINNSNQSVTIKSGVLDSHNWNITMGRVSYYYLLCAEEQLSFLYNLRVIETIESEYTTTDYGVEDAFMQIKRYDNITDIFVTISSLYTDANGYINLYLIPNVLHKVTISKAGYDTVTSDYYPTPPNAYGQTAEKIFKIIRSINGTTPIVYDDFWTTVVFTAAMNSTNATHIYYHDRSGNTINTQIYFYEFYMGITTFLFSDSKVGNQSFYWNITGLNKTRVYIAVLCFNTTNNFNLPENSVTVTIWPLGPFNNNTKFDIEERITDVFGEFKIGPQVFTWIGFFLSLIPLIILTLFDPANVGIGILTTGFFMAGVQIGLAAWTINSVNMLTVVLTPVVIFIGVLYILAQRQGLGNL